ncbi:unnamed protein product [Prorocentrum cordatum]|uniref:Uncharacterized protein n=1 Tax=Prorocentrum cordatum TaxID=2364126 RepID=A0ABN9U9P5_9DINO|nr:unnamed protein product [Polarella glacialis]
MPRVPHDSSTAELAAELVEQLTARGPKESPLLGRRGEPAGNPLAPNSAPSPPARPESPDVDQSLDVMEQSSMLAAQGGAPACGLLCAEAKGCLGAGPQSLSRALCRALGAEAAPSPALLAPRRKAAPAPAPLGEPPLGTEASPAAARRGGAGVRDGHVKRLFSSPSPRRRPPLQTPSPGARGGGASAQKERARRTWSATTPGW